MRFELPVRPELHPYFAANAAIIDYVPMRIAAALQSLTAEQLHKTVPGFTNSVATLVLHIAATNVQFAHEMKGSKVPEALQAEFKLDQPRSPIPVATGETAESLNEKLHRSTQMLIEAMGALGEPHLEAEVPFGGPGNTATVPFALMVAGSHGIYHVGQIEVLRKAL